MLERYDIPFEPAERLQGVALSEIVQISERAGRLRAEGRDIVALSTGEPDFPTPDFVIDAAMRAAREGRTRYTPTMGAPDLRAAVAEEHGCDSDEVIVSTGAKQVISNALLATLNPGDEVILPTPFWSSYADMVRLAGGRVVAAPCSMSDGFKLRASTLEAAITTRTRWLLLNSPSNPSGAVYSAAELAELAEVLERSDRIGVISDEIYAHLSFVEHAGFTTAAPSLASRTLTVSGVSKAWSMTGWRIGWGVGPSPLVKAMAAIQGASTSGACSVSQSAALAALRGDRELLTTRREAFRARRDRVVARLNAIGGIDCRTPEGAFYVFPAYAADVDDGELCAALLENAGVAVVPGRAFGSPGHFRLSFAYSDAALEDGLGRVAAAFDALA